jgi:hypothetical protein
MQRSQSSEAIHISAMKHLATSARGMQRRRDGLHNQVDDDRSHNLDLCSHDHGQHGTASFVVLLVGSQLQSAPLSRLAIYKFEANLREQVKKAAHQKLLYTLHSVQQTTQTSDVQHNQIRD